MEQIFSGFQSADKDRILEVLLNEGIDDLETLEAAREDDLHRAGLKMGDIIKIRRVLQARSKESPLNSSLSSLSETGSVDITPDSKKSPTQSKFDSVKPVNNMCRNSLKNEGHDGGSLSVGQWVAVAYNEGFFIGKITAINMRVLDETVEEIDVNFLTKTTKGNYKWPKRKDTDIVSTTYIFFSTPTVNEDGKNFVVNNEDNISKHYESYKKAYMIN